MREMSGVFLSIYILIFLVFIPRNFGLGGKKTAVGLLYIYTILATELNFKVPTE